MQNCNHFNKHPCPQQIIVPIIIICVITDVANEDVKREPYALHLTLERFDPPNFVLYHLKGPHVTPADVDKLQAKWHHKGTFLKSDDVAKGGWVWV